MAKRYRDIYFLNSWFLFIFYPGHENNASIMPVLDLAQRQYGGNSIFRVKKTLKSTWLRLASTFRYGRSCCDSRRTSDSSLRSRHFLHDVQTSASRQVPYPGRK